MEDGVGVDFFFFFIHFDIQAWPEHNSRRNRGVEPVLCLTSNPKETQRHLVLMFEISLENKK